MATNQGFKSLVPDRDRVDASYLYHWLDCNRSYLQSLGRGATFTEISKRITSEIPLPLPPIGEQRRIAAVLDQADWLRAKRRVARGLLDSLKDEIFRDMLGDPVTNPLRWPAHEVLGDVAAITSGVTKGRRLNTSAVRRVPYLAVANVQAGQLRLKAVKEIEATEEEIARYRLVPGDLVLTEGGDPDKLGRGTVWMGEIEECIHQNHIFRVRIHDPGFTPMFVSALLASERGRRYFLGAAKQTTGIASINKTQLSAFPLLRPPWKLQQQFVDQLRRRAQIEDVVDRHADELDSLFSSLQHRAFAGRL